MVLNYRFTVNYCIIISGLAGLVLMEHISAFWNIYTEITEFGRRKKFFSGNVHEFLKGSPENVNVNI